jgi:hypothetical protein
VKSGAGLTSRGCELIVRVRDFRRELWVFRARSDPIVRLLDVEVHRGERERERARERERGSWAVFHVAMASWAESR